MRWALGKHPIAMIHRSIPKAGASGILPSWPKGPTLYLAQANGLGNTAPTGNPRAKGPIDCRRSQTMPQSLAQLWVHIVFSTKDRRAYLQNENLRSEMFRMLAYHVKEIGCVSASVGGYSDHVHLLVGLSRTITISKLIEQTKTETSRWIKTREPTLSHFSWQAGYGVFSVSHSNRDSVDHYIRHQHEHHAKWSFQDEFRKLCECHGLEIDERYLWD
jgi:putative transposase